MNDGFKQRLVGAIVLGSMVLILWPVVFTKTTGPRVDKRSQIPERPLFEKYEVPQPTRPQDIEPASEAQDEAVAVVEKSEPAQDKPAPQAVEEKVVEQKDSNAKKEQPRLDKRGLPVSWVLQVASFSKHSNAVELKRALQKKGYKAYTRHVKTQAGESVRVYVGPKLTKDAFADDKKAIDKAFKVNSLIVRFAQ